MLFGPNFISYFELYLGNITSFTVITTSHCMSCRVFQNSVQFCNERQLIKQNLAYIFISFVCVICEKHIIGQDGTTLRRKGCDGIIAASQRGDEIGLRVQPGNRVHAKCRKDYTEANRIQSASKKRKYDDGSQHTIVCRSEVCTFNIKEKCVFCECGSTG